MHDYIYRKLTRSGHAAACQHDAGDDLFSPERFVPVLLKHLRNAMAGQPGVGVPVACPRFH